MSIAMYCPDVHIQQMKYYKRQVKNLVTPVCPSTYNHIQCVIYYSDFLEPCPARDLPCVDEAAVPWRDGVTGVLWQNGHKFHVQKIQTKCPSAWSCYTVVTTSHIFYSWLTKHIICKWCKVLNIILIEMKCFPHGIGGIMQSQAYLRKM